MVTYMRSNDACIGLPHDIFFFTMLQELIARDLSISLGSYKHVVGSLHLYESDRDMAQRFLDEGWQSSTQPMPAMPPGSPWSGIGSLLNVEAACRAAQALAPSDLTGLHPYWCDLLRLLDFFRAYKQEDLQQVTELRAAFDSIAYLPFLEHKIRLLRDAVAPEAR